LLPPEPMDATGPEVLECAVVLLSRMVREHRGEAFASVADRVANVLRWSCRLRKARYAPISPSGCVGLKWDLAHFW
jgi:hypothetical protein